MDLALWNHSRPAMKDTASSWNSCWPVKDSNLQAGSARGRARGAVRAVRAMLWHGTRAAALLRLAAAPLACAQATAWCAV